ncbi:hypothetical protein SLA2020_017900 [Shorea laevis]
MKVAQKESVVWDQIQMRSPSANALVSGSPTRPVPKLMVWLILFVSLTYVVYTLKLLTAPSQAACDDHLFSSSTVSKQQHISLPSISNRTLPTPTLSIQNQTVVVSHRDVLEEARKDRTEIHHIVFGIATSSRLWQKRKEYIKIWYKPKQVRGVVWLDNRVKYTAKDREALPPVRIFNVMINK